MEIGENCYTTDPKISHSLIFIMNVNFQYIVSPTVVPRPLSNDPRLFQCIYRYSHASKRFVGV